jgi:ElaB/YqjD/DUF883 family membrane-anchored ribosome-binding protein
MSESSCCNQKVGVGLDNLRDDVVKKAENLQSAISEKAGEAIEGVCEMGREVREMGREARQKAQEGLDLAAVRLDQGRRSVACAGRSLQTQIEQHPLAALAIGGAVGFLVGAILFPRR